MKKLNKKQNKRLGYMCGISMAVFLITLASVLLFKNMNWINFIFFLFGMMFLIGYAVLIGELKKIRMEAKVNV